MSDAQTPLAQSDDEVEALTADAARPASPGLARHSPPAQALPQSSSSNSLATAAGSSPEPPTFDGNGSSPAVLSLDVTAAARPAGTSSAAAADAGDGSDGDSPRYSAHPATMQTIRQNIAAGGGGSPASSTGTSSPSVAAATAAKSAGFKIAATSWLQVGGKGSDVTGLRVGSGDAARPAALGRTVSNASAEGAAPASPASSWGSRGGDTALSDLHAESAPGPSPLGLGSGRLTADQAAAAARILMAGGTLPGSPTTQTDSPFARAQHADGGHISFSNSSSSRGRSASEGPQSRIPAHGRLGAAPQQSGGAQHVFSTQLGNAALAQLEGPGSASQPPPRIRSSTSMSRIAEEAASAAVDTEAAAELRPPTQASPDGLQQHASNEVAGCTVEQAAAAQSSQHGAALMSAGLEAAEIHKYDKHESLPVNAVTLQL